MAKFQRAIERGVDDGADLAEELAIVIDGDDAKEKVHDANKPRRDAKSESGGGDAKQRQPDEEEQSHDDEPHAEGEIEEEEEEVE